MRPPEYSAEEIVAAGKEIVAAGRNVTGFALRSKLGGGNASRLKQVWDEQTTQPDGSAEPRAELPVELVEQLDEVKKVLADVLGEQLAALARKLNDRAQKAAERRIVDIEQRVKQTLDQATEELADAQRNVEKIEEERDAAKVEVGRFEQRLAEQQEQVHARDVELAQLTERLTQAERAVEVANGLAEKARQELHLKLQAESAESAELRAKLDHAQRALHEARQQAASEVQRHVERCNNLKEKLAEAQAEVKRTREETARLTGRLEELQMHRTELANLLQARGAAPDNQAGEGSAAPASIPTPPITPPLATRRAKRV